MRSFFSDESRGCEVSANARHELAISSTSTLISTGWHTPDSGNMNEEELPRQIACRPRFNLCGLLLVGAVNHTFTECELVRASERPRPSRARARDTSTYIHSEDPERILITLHVRQQQQQRRRWRHE